MGNGEINNFTSTFDRVKDGGLTDIEQKKLRLLFLNLPQSEQESVLDQYSTLANEPEKSFFDGLKFNIKELKDDFETKKRSPLMNELSKRSNSKLFNMVLNKPEGKIMYGVFMKDVTKKYGEYFKNGSDTLNIVYWKKITNDLGIKAIGAFGMDKLGSMFNSILGKISNISSKAEGDMDIEEMGDLMDQLSSLGEGNDDGGKEKNTKLGDSMGPIKKVMGFLHFITKEYSENLDLLISLGKNNKEGLRMLLDNPMVLSKVLETGEYKEDGYDINLKDKKVSFNNHPELVESKKAFLELAVEATNKNGKTLDNLKNKVKDLAGLFKKVGLDTNTLREFRDGLKEIPLIGEFLSALAGFFIGDKLLKFMDNNPWEDNYEKPGKSLQLYIKDNSEKIPFKLGNNDFEDEEVIGDIEGFLEKVDKQDRKYFKDKKVAKQIGKKEKRKELINSKSFWKDIFSNEELTNNSILEKVRFKVKEITKGKESKDVNIKDLFKELNNMEFKDITTEAENPVIVDKTKTGAKAAGVAGYTTLASDSNTKGPNTTSKAPKTFIQLLDSPTVITETKITLVDNSEIYFDRTEGTLNIGEDSFGINKIGDQKEGVIFNMIKGIIKSKLNFQDIFNNTKDKYSIIKVLVELKEKGNSEYEHNGTLIKFGKIEKTA